MVNRVLTGGGGGIRFDISTSKVVGCLLRAQPGIEPGIPMGLATTERHS